MTTKEISDWVETAMSLGAAPFTVLCVIVFGYVLRLIPKFPNDWIPIASVVIGTILFPLLAHRHPDDTLKNFLTRTIFMGMIIGFGATSFHQKIIANYEDKIPFLGKLLSKAQNKKDDDSGHS